MKFTNRPIEFRVWDNTNGIMYFPDVKGLFHIMGVPVYIGSNFFLLQSSRFAITQFTGLLDKNGKKIFEGDIVITRDYINREGTMGFIKFEKGSFEVFGNDNHPLGYEEEFLIGGCKVLGNIFENPEMSESLTV